jgi:hypothetical protein
MLDLNPSSIRLVSAALFLCDPESVSQKNPLPKKGGVFLLYSGFGEISEIRC